MDLRTPSGADADAIHALLVARDVADIGRPNASERGLKIQQGVMAANAAARAHLRDPGEPWEADVG